MEKAQTTPTRDKELFECHEKSTIMGAEMSRLQGRLATMTQVALGLGGALILATGAAVGSWVSGRKRGQDEQAR